MKYTCQQDRETKADRLHRQRVQERKRKEREARKRLNEAAPDLLKACIAAINDTKGLSPSDYLHTTTMNMIQAAIAKAKGE